MRIYIDESGNFQPESSASRVCCVAALVVPDECAITLLGEFEALRSSWGVADAEQKGHNLTDDQTATTVRLLGRYDVLLELAAVDVGLHSIQQVVDFQERQADAITAGLTSEHNDNSRRWAHALRQE